VLGPVGALGRRAGKSRSVGDRRDVLDTACPDAQSQARVSRRAQIASAAFFEVGQGDDHAADSTPLELGEDLGVHIPEAGSPETRTRRDGAEREGHVLGGGMGLHEPPLGDAHLDLEREEVGRARVIGMGQRVLDHELGDGVALLPPGRLRVCRRQREQHEADSDREPQTVRTAPRRTRSLRN
jgi:hypothetical protein